MHLKTNIEHSAVQIIVLAMCPLLFAVSSVNDAVFFMCGTIVCTIISQLLLMLFNKYLNNDVKALLTALVSALIVTAASIALKELKQMEVHENAYLVVFSTTILNAEFIYFNSKALRKHYFFNVLKITFIFSLLLFIFAFVKEILAFGSIYERQLFEFDGIEFCKTVIFDLLLIASICAVADFTVRYIDKQIETKNMIYQKYVRIIRSEKAFQYDKLRREKLLANEIEVNRINKMDSEKIKRKEAENEAIESVREVVSEEEEIVDISVAEELEESKAEENVDETKKKGRTKTKKKKGGKK